MSNFDDLAAEHAEWSQKTFGMDSDRGPLGPLRHLEKEAKEAQNDPNDQLEYADCFLLVIDAARRAGISASELVEISLKKLQINKNRTWPTANKDQPVEHNK